MRNYWQPVALVEEIDTSVRPLISIELLGQELILFRNQEGSLGLVDRHCPHRCADLFFGRLEDGGLRCHFHGWLFAVDGHCIETPAEPEGSQLASKIHLGSYPVFERNGIIWGYLGSGEPPAVPTLDCFEAPEAYTFAFKGYLDCNWLQALEVGIDPAHASFLHRFFQDDDPQASYGKQFRATSLGSELPMTRILREYDRPVISNERTPYGQKIIAVRHLVGPGQDGTKSHVRITNQVFPHGIVIPLSSSMTITQWHVPINDTSCYWYASFTSLDDPIDKDEMHRQRMDSIDQPGYRPKRNRSNNYLFDPLEAETLTYTGLGADINVHDQMAVEGQGKIHDRSQEHLGRSDKAILTYRRMLIENIERISKGELPMYVSYGEQETGSANLAVAFDGIVEANRWADAAIDAICAQRAASPWASSTGVISKISASASDVSKSASHMPSQLAEGDQLQ